VERGPRPPGAKVNKLVVVHRAETLCPILVEPVGREVGRSLVNVLVRVVFGKVPVLQVEICLLVSNIFIS
jgi:hypothetical protein